MVFVFPGIIFRKFYFRGNFTSQFSKGNLFERFIITLFFSIISLTLCIGFIYFLRHVFKIDFLSSVSHETIINTLNDIKQENIPLNIKENASEFIMLMGLVYSISLVLGATLHTIVVKLRLDIIFRLLRFDHPWHYIVNGKTNKQIKNKKYLSTNIDILINDGYKTKLYSGFLLDMIIDHGTKEIKHILVQNCQEYKFKDKNITNANTLSTYLPNSIEKKSIKGHIMCFPKENIINFNLTHVTIEKDYKISKKILSFFSAILTILFFVSLIYVVISPWIENMLFKISSIPRKIVFSITSIILLSIAYGELNGLLEIKKPSKIKEFTLPASILFFGMFLNPLIWAIGYSSWLNHLSIVAATTIVSFIIEIIFNNTSIQK